jgi:hypothetical protein
VHIFAENYRHQKFDGVALLPARDWIRNSAKDAGYQYGDKGERHHISAGRRRLTYWANITRRGQSTDSAVLGI